jgi:hypothetical protein
MSRTVATFRGRHPNVLRSQASLNAAWPMVIPMDLSAPNWPWKMQMIVFPTHLPNDDEYWARVWRPWRLVLKILCVFSFKYVDYINFISEFIKKKIICITSLDRGPPIHRPGRCGRGAAHPRPDGCLVGRPIR